MKKNTFISAPFFLTFTVFSLVSIHASPSLYAGEDHSELIESILTTPQEVTQTCLECHESAAEDFMKTAHWLWRGKTPFVKGHESKESLGKINLMNDY